MNCSFYFHSLLSHSVSELVGRQTMVCPNDSSACMTYPYAVLKIANDC